MATAKRPTTKSTKRPTTSIIAAKRAAASAKADAARAHAEVVKARATRLTGRGAGFVNFIREQGVVGLAVGLAIGTAAGDTVKKLVEGFISPVVQFIVGSREGLEKAAWTFDWLGRQAEFKWGAFVSSAITLLATALVIYLIIHVLKLDRLDRKKDA